MSITQHDVERRVDGELLAPARQPGVLYVASQLTCLSLPEHDDLVFPYPVVKYPDGHQGRANLHMPLVWGSPCFGSPRTERRGLWLMAHSD